ncbi:glycoside hydrolase N-terminal domain-containing protein [Cellulomonas denverensis]|uniref:glycoside hydrolase N-terminal domain-containing protein n=1 Tax=Cellulomonas denverensis TaxID=264297 RepID=UPI0035F039DA
MTGDHPGRELRFSQPSEGWLDGLPLGNGRTGAMVLAAPDRLRLALNDTTAWSGGPGSAARRGTVTAEQAAHARAEAGRLWDQGRIVEAERALAVLQQDYVQSFLSLADLVLRLGVDPGASLVRALSLRDGEHRVLAAGVRQTTFVSAVDRVLVHRLTADRPIDVDLELATRLGEPALTRLPDGAVLRMTLPADVAPGHEPGEPPLRWQVEGG